MFKKPLFQITCGKWKPPLTMSTPQKQPLTCSVFVLTTR